MALARLLGLALALLCGVAQASGPSAQEILTRSYLATRFPDSTGELRMVLRSRAGKERVRQLSIYSKLQGDGPEAMYALQFHEPADIKGTGTLLVQRVGGEDDMWVYLPALRKTRRLFSDNKRDSFMGSDLSYGDILGHRPGDWTARLLREERFGGVPVYVIEAMPVASVVRSSSGYGKRVMLIDKTNFVNLKTEFFDEAGEPLKTVVVTDVKAFGGAGRWQFMRLEVEQLQKGSHTTLVYEDFKSNTGLSADKFTPAALERGLR